MISYSNIHIVKFTAELCKKQLKLSSIQPGSLASRWLISFYSELQTLISDLQLTGRRRKRRSKLRLKFFLAWYVKMKHGFFSIKNFIQLVSNNQLVIILTVTFISPSEGLQSTGFEFDTSIDLSIFGRVFSVIL